MKCVQCGAPLNGKSIKCHSCGAMNDRDLRALHRELGRETASDRKCPRCDILMKSVDLGIDGVFYIERCDRCLGLFFDPGELDRVVEVSTCPPEEPDVERLAGMVEETFVGRRRGVRYAKCPVCGKFMNRKRHGSMSGVIVNVCRDHGVWLDGGELAQIVRWINMGGRQVEEEKLLFDAEAEAQRRHIADCYGGLPRVGEPGESPTLRDGSLADIVRRIIQLW